MKRRKLPTGSPEDLRERAARCSARALGWLRRGAEFERAARRSERKRDKMLYPWPCPRCYALYATEGELTAHRAGKLPPDCVG